MIGLRNKVVVSLVFLIRLYQRTFSFDHGWFKAIKPYGACKYYPSCSEYTRQAILIHGPFKGLKAGGKRILRCHPWAQGGYDPVQK